MEQLNKDMVCDISEKFMLDGVLLDCQPLKCGHINDTFRLNIKTISGDSVNYILQRINTEVFKNPLELMENIKAVTSHLRKKIELAGGDSNRETLNLVETRDGNTFFVDNHNRYWRVFTFIENAKTYQIVEKPEHLFATGKVIGKFQRELLDFPVETLYETIPDFHNTPKRYEAFEEAVEQDIKGRVESVQDEIDFIKSRVGDMHILVDLIDKEEIPVRVTHNDTKFNNIMLDCQSEEGVALIDLDTVMPGLSLYDFGDTIRSGATTALEDEADLSKVNFDINLFEQFAKGFLSEVGSFLTKNEVKYLAFSAKLITLELAMRFLMDHINGDTYFKIERPNHNLERARNQMKLVSDMEERMDEMNEIVRKYI